MGPGWLNLILGLHTSLGELEVGLFEVGKGSEDVLLDHGHYIVQVGDDKGNHCLLVLQ